jgi:hypothetical protein
LGDVRQPHDFYIQEVRLTAAELVAEVGVDPIFKFWVWERTQFATTT